MKPKINKDQIAKNMININQGVLGLVQRSSITLERALITILEKSIANFTQHHPKFYHQTSQLKFC